MRIPHHLWQKWLGDPHVVARFETKRYRRPDHRCWPWLGAVSSTGHGSFRAASLPGSSRRGTVPAHLFAYQLAHGVIPRLGWSGTADAVLCHQCDFAGCTNPAHLRLGTNASNRAEYTLRKHNPTGALAVTRGPAGRTRAIAAAIRTSTRHHENPDTTEKRIRVAEAVGQPLTLW
ncbi:HNH endonuclease [Rhodococcus marinonascens]|uniref:HNH endonuclease n=1 Tax=Rhodococcus marinonascens TaxID=38311 RepID=UPI000B301B8D|nr:HNH endonuclease [Rhodococcus marinonascens]